MADYVVKRFFQEALRLNRSEDPTIAGDKKKADEMPRESMNEASANAYVKLFQTRAVSMERKKLKSEIEHVISTKSMYCFQFLNNSTRNAGQASNDCRRGSHCLSKKKYSSGKGLLDPYFCALSLSLHLVLPEQLSPALIKLHTGRKDSWEHFHCLDDGTIVRWWFSR